MSSVKFLDFLGERHMVVPDCWDAHVGLGLWKSRYRKVPFLAAGPFWTHCSSRFRSDIVYIFAICKTSRKHAYIILITLNPYLYSKTGFYRGKHHFHISAQKRRLWVFVRTASSRRFWRVPKIYVLSRIMKNIRISNLKLFIFWW